MQDGGLENKTERQKSDSTSKIIAPPPPPCPPFCQALEKTDSTGLQACRNRIPQPGWLITEVYCLIVLNTRGLRPEGQGGTLPLTALGEDLSWPLPASGGGWRSLAFLGW